MEQFRRIGEVLGSLKAIMVLQDDIQFNQNQCYLLYDMFSLAFDTIAEEIRDNLKLEEKNTKWKALEQPLKELHKVFKEGELYIKQCIDSKDWWAKVITSHQNKECIEFHIHNLLSCFPAVIEAIEMAGEISGLDQDEMEKKRLVLTRKYDMEWNDLKLFHWRFGKQYLVPPGICNRMLSVSREDRWLLVEVLKEKITSPETACLKNEQRLGELLIKKLNNSESLNAKLFPSSVLFGTKDYQVRRRLEGGQYKEVQWFGENFCLRQFMAEGKQIDSEVQTVLSLSHPNIIQYLCGFLDEKKKEYFLIMELISKDLSSCMKDNNGARRRILFPLPVVVDIMLQIARAMEYLHSQMIYHGDLNPTNVFLKPRNSSEGYYLVKVTGFGLSSVKNPPPRSSTDQMETNPFIWHAPEVMAEQEQGPVRKTEKADVYSFGMLCFELLTGKVPFEDGYLRGEKMSRNIRAGERPLFPFPSPKYLVSLTKRCWHCDPSQRLSFSSICRILRQVKKFLAMNPESDRPELQTPTADYCNVEAGVARKLSSDGVGDLCSVSQIPFQMFAYNLAEKEKTWESGSDVDEPVCVTEDPFTMLTSDTRSLYSDTRSIYSEAPPKKMLTTKKLPHTKIRKGTRTLETKTRTTSKPRVSKTNRNIPLPFLSPLSKGRRMAMS
ncbi:Light-sensor Protein kinase, partial [Cucurbita argyrosperma subsp. sororia]